MGGVPGDTHARATQTAKLRFFFFFIKAGLLFWAGPAFSPETGGMLFLLFPLFGLLLWLLPCCGTLIS
jgi:hypothetical protein